MDESLTGIYTNEAHNSCDKVPGVGMSENTVYSNEAYNSRKFPGVGKSCGVGSNEAHNSGRSVMTDARRSGTMVTSRTEAAAADADMATALPEKRTIPPFPVGEITQEVGEKYCKLICDTYPEVFNGEKGHFRGAEATMFIKEGHMDELLKIGARPAARLYAAGLKANIKKM